MAIDEALLQQVSEKSSPPVLRLYGFSPPCLSVGRFQRIRDHLQFEQLEQDLVTLVRRPTGGQAVLHDHELTYAVVTGRDHLEPFSKRGIYTFIAELLLEGLKVLGIHGISRRERLGSPHNPDCFASTGEYEISNRGQQKLIGSAQLITRAASLQHGAVPLDRTYQKIDRYFLYEGAPDRQTDRKAGSLQEELGHKVSYQEAQTAFRKAFESQINVEVSTLTGAEEKLVNKLLQEKYTAEEWNIKF